MLTPIGDVIELRTARSSATVATLAAALTSLEVDGRELTERTPSTRLPGHGNGIVLAPWPNRVRDARWTHRGEVQQLDITDPSRGNAIHGLLRNTAYRVLERADDAVALGARIHPQHGWPFLLETWVRYALAEDGLTVTHGVRNLGAEPAPWAVGAHPYFRVGEVPVEQLTLEVRAEGYLELDERLVPVAVREVEPGGEFDLSAPRELGGLDLNVGYQDVVTGPEGAAVLTAPDGARVVVWQDEPFRWLQVFTPRDFPHVDAEGAEAPALAVALEPMTAAPDALNSGEGLVWLEPDQDWEASWGVRYEEGE
ncbi:aldose 1-epimerase family protein [Protaetiibacter sp. SSC-01]|uniref:aldose 1-epimerase family protein n=1 Tax=Protaetiibacter sp. SSC-01 TaxID=2759943 RepID=UPI001656DF60|nr:aldose 1-epimerase family protein [Protaetiibacter sp. SSC-01]QNO37918.1 aldose 1-epimerase family protein [Protaetiibacter sp. SSC-01]